MSIASSTAVSAANLQSDIGIRVVKKQRDVSKQEGEAAVALIQAAAQVQEAQNARATQPGRVDTYA
jgi:hypothetical protein